MILAIFVGEKMRLEVESQTIKILFDNAPAVLWTLPKSQRGFYFGGNMVDFTSIQVYPENGDDSLKISLYGERVALSLTFDGDESNDLFFHIDEIEEIIETLQKVKKIAAL